MGDFQAPQSHIGKEKKILVKNLVEEEKKTKASLQEEFSRKQNFTRTILCPASSTSRGGITSLKDFTAILERQFERSELQKAGLTSTEQDLYFQFREKSKLPESQSFKDKLSVISEKIQDYFKDDVQDKVQEAGKFKRPIDEISKVEKELFDDLEDVPSLRKRRKMMIREERKLEKVRSSVSSGDIPTSSVRSSKSKWDQR